MKSKFLWTALTFIIAVSASAQEQANQLGDSRRADLGKEVQLEVLYIPPGDFMMGSTPEEKIWATGIEGGAQAGTQRESFEGQTPRAMKVSQAFWMGRTEVTVGQFRRFVEETGYITDAEKPDGKTQCFNPKWTSYHLSTQITHPWEPMPGKSWRDPNFQFPMREDFPVVCVSWTDAKAFASWLTEHQKAQGRLPEGLVYRLPTEAEWENACRAGTTTPWYSVDDVNALKEYGWFGFNAQGKTHPVGQKWPNAWGLCDMHGNAWEWCQDWYARETYRLAPRISPQGPPKGQRVQVMGVEGPTRVIRGGGFGRSSLSRRVTVRSFFPPNRVRFDLGFRVVRELGLDPPRLPSPPTPN